MNFNRGFMSLSCYCKYLIVSYLLVPRIQAAMIIPLLAISTGITSGTFSLSTSMDRATPVPIKIIPPIGPVKVSTQPGIGSFIVGSTEVQ